MKTIGIIGSRRRYTPKDWLLVYEAFCQNYQEGDKVCSGMCRTGADQFAVLCSDIWDVEPIWHWPEAIPKHSPKWKYAQVNYARNALIARDSDVLIACVAEDRKGGTENTIQHFQWLEKTKLILV